MNIFFLQVILHQSAPSIFVEYPTIHDHNPTRSDIIIGRLAKNIKKLFKNIENYINLVKPPLIFQDITKSHTVHSVVQTTALTYQNLLTQPINNQNILKSAVIDEYLSKSLSLHHDDGRPPAASAPADHSTIHNHNFDHSQPRILGDARAAASRPTGPPAGRPSGRHTG